MAIPPDLPRLPPRTSDAHKGTFGRVLVVAGSRGMTGAAVLSGAAALRGGAGLVRVACPVEVQPIVAMGNPCYMTVGLPHHADGTYSESSFDDVLRYASEADVLAIGPGLGNRSDVARLVRHLLTACPDTPAVVDADALNVLAADADEWPIRNGPTVLTPHPGEFARMRKIPTAGVQANRENLAREFAARNRVVVLLKGQHTIITDGARTRINETGNPGMATGGSGDVLTGLLAALLAQGLSAFEASALAAWVHGHAGDLASAELSQVALTAADLLDYLPLVFRELEPG